MRSKGTFHLQVKLKGERFPSSFLSLGTVSLALVAILLGFLPARAASAVPEDSSLASILKKGLSGIDGYEFWRALREGPGSSFRLADEKYGFDPLQPGKMGGGWPNLQLEHDETKAVGPGVTIRRMVYE